MFYFVFFFEIFLFLIFFLLVVFLFRRKKTEEVLFLLIPLILFEFFVEYMSIKNGKFLNNKSYDLFLFFGVSLGTLVLWAIGFYIAFQITNKINLKFNFSTFLLSIIDALIIMSGSLVINPLGLKIGWWKFGEYNYLVKGSFFGVPVWEFIGCFLGMFIFSFLYRNFKVLPFQKRLIFTYGAVFLIVLMRIILYNFLNIF